MHSDDSETAIGTNAPPGTGFEVAPETLLAAAKIIEAQANTLADRLVAAAGAVRVDAPASDTVSVHVIEAWNALAVDGEDAYLPRAVAYLDGLRELAARLRAASGRYESDDAAALADFSHRGIG